MTPDVTRRRFLATAAAGGTLGVAACLGSDDEGGRSVDRPLAVSNAHQYSSPGCRCCRAYASYLGEQIEGTLAETRTDDVAAVKRRHGVPREVQSCHTVVLDEYVVEGHVPADVVATLLAAEPSIDGIALPGMPAGSPGMGGNARSPLTVYAFADGQTGDVFAER